MTGDILFLTPAFMTLCVPLLRSKKEVPWIDPLPPADAFPPTYSPICHSCRLVIPFSVVSDRNFAIDKCFGLVDIYVSELEIDITVDGNGHRASVPWA